MRLVEGVVERRAAMTRGAERDPARRNLGVRRAREIGRHQPRDIGEHRRLDGLAGFWIDIGHGGPLNYPRKLKQSVDRSYGLVMAGHSRSKDGVASARLCPAIHVFCIAPKKKRGWPPRGEGGRGEKCV